MHNTMIATGVLGNIILTFAGVLLTTTAESELQTSTHRLVIGTSSPMPTVGEDVIIDVLPQFLSDAAKLTVTTPQGHVREVALSERGEAAWQPERYGRHILRYGTHTRDLWVTARPAIFNWWTTGIEPKHITSAMVPEDQDADYWQRRGVTRLHWIGGEYLAREEHAVPFRQPEQWFQQWWGRLAETAERPRQGVCLDEVFGTDERVDGMALPKAVAMLRRAAGEDFRMGVYYSGITEEFHTGMWYLRQAGVMHLNESYWGTEEIYRIRWQAIALYRLQERGVLVISPGFNQSERVRGSLTPEELRAEFAMVRRTAPDAAGLGVFNAYNAPELEQLADELIEEYFLKPVIHLQPQNGGVLVRNIGHEDAVGCSLVFLNQRETKISSITLNTLAPMKSQLVEVPSDAVTVRLSPAPGMAQIYPNGSYRLPEALNPLQVVGASITDMEQVNSPDGRLIFRIMFNQELDRDSIRNQNVLVHGVQTGTHTASVEYDQVSHSLTVKCEDLPADHYTLRLLSGANGIRDIEGRPLDGSGNGLVESVNDHYAVHFRLSRERVVPELLLPE